MAKWGEGDPRWIVEERPDATNVNNWHWTEKNASYWSKEKLTALLLNTVIDDPKVGHCKIKEINSIEGEAVANNRKGKLIFFYEWVIKCSWAGNLNGDSEEIKGKLEIPNLSEENSAQDITIDVSLEDSTDDKAIKLKEMVRIAGLSIIRDKVDQYMKALRDEFARDMIKPSKLNEGGSINSFQTEVQLNKKPSVENSTVKQNLMSKKPSESNSTVPTETANLQVYDIFKCTAEEMYHVFTAQNFLQAFTQSQVVANNVVGGEFSLFNGNIQGNFTHLEPNKCIKQRWRLRSWPMNHYSEVIININQKEDSTEVTILQTGVPHLELERTEEGWKKHYFEMIKRTFGFGVSIF